MAVVVVADWPAVDDDGASEYEQPVTARQVTGRRLARNTTDDSLLRFVACQRCTIYKL